MKIYLFDPETGVYLGEDFADEAPMGRDAYLLPDDATEIEPPEVGGGQFPVFHVDEKRWKVCSLHRKDYP